MRRTNSILGLAAVVALALAAPSTAGAAVGYDAVWQGQGQGQGRGNDDARAQGNEGRGNGAAARPQGNQGRDNGNAARAQGNQGRDNGNAARPQGDQGRDNDNAARGQGNSGRANATVDRGERGNRGNAARGRNRSRPDVAQFRASVDRMPEAVRRLVTSNRRSERAAASAFALASLRGVDANRIRIDDRDGWTEVRNSDDRVLFRLDDDEELGAWRMRRLGDRRPNDESPAFCRSGEGHPVWGREWCIEKGFGLGGNDRSIWSRTDDDLDVIFRRRPEANVLDRDGLIGVLGDIVFGRLAVQSLALGNDEPLVGRWVASSEERDAPFVLRINAGDVAVAELIDDDRDNEVDVLYVVQPRW